MEDSAKGVGPEHALEYSEAIIKQVLEVEMPVEELMHYLIPFPIVLIKAC